MSGAKFKAIAVVILTLLGCQVVAAENPYSAEEILKIEKTCIDLGRFYAKVLDEGEPERVSEVFAEHANWEGAGGKIVGRQDIHTAFSNRPKGRVSLHLVSNERAEVISKNMTIVSSNFLLYRGNGGREMMPLPNNDPLNRAGVYDDECVLTDSGWLLQSRKVRMMFAGDATSPTDGASSDSAGSR